MGENVIVRDVIEDVTNSYLEYGFDVIIGRALPDVRDGCKPVHRRILHAMQETGNTYDKAYKKSARTVGEVLGKYHPHGDSSVYDAMVRMAQPFSLRYPFVDGHGNFGSIDGDSAAAMRYTEARMSKIAALMMEDIDKNTINMVKNYDGTLDEPSVLPSKLPNLLINGVEGIAVGFATKMPPHNLSEVMEGVIETIDNPDITIDELMKHIKAPDFPSGGMILGLDGVRDAYTTGKGDIRIRSKYIIEDVPKHINRQQIVFTEIPYQVNKSELVDTIHNLGTEKIIEDIMEVRDESSVRDGIRIVVELKKSANISKIIKKLFKKTKLETSFSVKSNALVPTKNGKLVPRMLTLLEIIKYFIKHREEIIQRKYDYLLGKAKARQHIVEGLIKAIDIVDKVIATIRANKNTSEAKKALMKEYDFSEEQSLAILDFRLQKLTGLEIEKLIEEKKELDKNIEKYTLIISSEKNILKEVRKDCKEVLDKYGDERKTEIQLLFKSSDEETDKDFDDNVVAQDVVVTITNTGYIKRVPLDTYSAQSRGGKGIKGINNKNIDIISQMFVTNTKCLLLCFGSDGRMYKLPVSSVTEESRTAKGQYLNALIEADSNVKIVAITEIHDAKYEGYILMFSRLGGVKKIKLSDLITKRRSINAINIRNEEDSLINACLVQETNNVFIATNKGIIICFDHKDLNAHGRASGTVRAIKLNPDDFVVNADIMKDEDSLLTVTNTGIGKRTINTDYKIQAHGGKGSLNYKLKKGENIVSVVGLNNDKDILIACDNGKLIRTPAESIRDLSRVSRGVRLVNLTDNENVVCVSSVIKDENEDNAILDE